MEDNLSYAKISCPGYTHQDSTTQHDACYTCHVTVIGFHWETYSLSAVVYRQSCIHPHDRNSVCWLLLTSFSHFSHFTSKCGFPFPHRCLCLLQQVDIFSMEFLTYYSWWREIYISAFQFAWPLVSSRLKQETFWHQVPALSGLVSLICHLISLHTTIECHTTHQHSSCFTQSRTRRENADHLALHNFDFSLVTQETNRVVISGTQALLETAA